MSDLLGSPHLFAINKTVRWKPFGGPKRTILCRGRRGVTSSATMVVDNIENYQKLSGKVQHLSSTSNELFWILDSGATYHIGIVPNLFTLYKTILNCWSSY